MRASCIAHRGVGPAALLPRLVFGAALAALLLVSQADAQTPAAPNASRAGVRIDHSIERVSAATDPARQAGADFDAIRYNLMATLESLHAAKEPVARLTGKVSEGGPAAVAEPPREVIAAPPAERVTPTEILEMNERPITSLTTNIEFDGGDLPPDLAGTNFAPQSEAPFEPCAVRPWACMSYQWAAAGLWHGPLYFEEVNLERYGYAHRRNWIFQPVISGGRFVATVAALPYMVALHPPHECVYTLGYYRPGSCVPFQARLMELNAVAAGAQAATVTGLIFAIP